MFLDEPPLEPHPDFLNTRAPCVKPSRAATPATRTIDILRNLQGCRSICKIQSPTLEHSN